MIEELKELQKKIITESLDDRDKTLQIIESAEDFNVLGLGVSRVGISVDPETVAKIAWRDRGLTDNLIESKLWKYVEESNPSIAPDPNLISSEAEVFLRDLIAPVKDYEDNILYMQRCIQVNYQRGDQKMHKLTQDLMRFGITDSAVNLGLLNTELVCFDYCYISERLYDEIMQE